jgi:hypothetical protein
MSMGRGKYRATSIAVGSEDETYLPLSDSDGILRMMMMMMMMMIVMVVKTNTKLWLLAYSVAFCVCSYMLRVLYR